MQFKEAFPELQTMAPTLPGETPVLSKLLGSLRRQQLHDLARAFDVPVKPDGTKTEILPALVAAEAAGVFAGKPKRPYYLLKASRTTDMAAINHAAVTDAEAADPFAPLEERPATTEPAPDKAPLPSKFQEQIALKKECKARGINCWGKSTAWMREALANPAAAPQMKVEASGNPDAA